MRTLPDYHEIEKDETMKERIAKLRVRLAYWLMGSNRVFISSRPLGMKDRLVMIELTEGRAYVARMPRRRKEKKPGVALVGSVGGPL
jgi:hypothetical protein